MGTGTGRTQETTCQLWLGVSPLVLWFDVLDARRFHYRLAFNSGLD